MSNQNNFILHLTTNYFKDFNIVMSIIILIIFVKRLPKYADTQAAQKNRDP
jgi:hypothetical protein